MGNRPKFSAKFSPVWKSLFNTTPWTKSLLIYNNASRHRKSLLLGFSRLTGNAPYLCFDVCSFICHWNVSIYNVSVAAEREGQSVTQETLKLYHETIFRIYDSATQLQTLLRWRENLCWREEPHRGLYSILKTKLNWISFYIDPIRLKTFWST